MRVTSNLDDMEFKRHRMHAIQHSHYTDMRTRYEHECHCSRGSKENRQKGMHHARSFEDVPRRCHVYHVTVCFHTTLDFMAGEALGGVG